METGPGSNRFDVTLREFTSGQKVFSRYNLIRVLGRGGMGVVWLAHDEVLERDVALKFLPELIVHDRGILEDLKRETKRSLELTHKNIIRIHDFVHDSGSGCISMEYVEGETLSNLRADKPAKIFEPGELKPWLSQLCDALDYAHTHARVIHRDLKPANLMINLRGELKIADFGIARSLNDSVSMLTQGRGTSGTLVYMSPQQLAGERASALDDIYSLGAMIYELLTSKPPFYSGDVSLQIQERIAPLMRQRRSDLEIEGNPIPKNWEETVGACLAKDPNRRPQSLAEVASRLQLTSVPGKTESTNPSKRRPELVPRLGEEDRPRNRKWLAVAGLMLLLGLGAAAWWRFGFPLKSLLPAKNVATEQVAPHSNAAPPPTVKVEPTAVKVESPPPVVELPKQSAPLPPDAKAPFDKGSTAAAQKEWALAAKYFDEARKNAPAAPEILFHLATAESNLPDHDLRALVWFKAYLAAAPAADKAAEATSAISKLEINIEAAIARLMTQAKQIAPQAKQWSALAETQAKTGDIAGALQTVSQISNDTYGIDKSSAYLRIARIQAEAGDIAGAESTIYQISYPDYVCDAQVALANAQFKAGKIEDAKVTLVRARQKRLEVYNKTDQANKVSAAQTCGYSLSGVGVAQANFGDLEGAQQTYNAIPPGKYADSPKQQIQQAIGAARSRQAQAKLQSAAPHEARQIALSITDPSARSQALQPFIQQDVDAGHFDDAARLVEQIDPKSIYAPISYTTLIGALQKANKTAEARQALVKVKASVHQMVTWSSYLYSLIELATSLGDFDTAKAIATAFSPAERDKAMDYYLKGSALAKAKSADFNGAKAVAASIKDNFVRADGIGGIIKAQIKNGAAADALRTLELLSDPAARAPYQRDIVDYLSKTRQFAEAEKAALAIQAPELRDSALTVVLGAVNQSGQFAESERIIALLGKVSVRAAQYCSLGSLKQSVGYREKGFEAIDRATAICSGIADPSDKSSCYQNVAAYYANGRLAEAQKNLGLARTVALTVSDPEKRVAALSGQLYYQDICLNPGEKKRSLSLGWDSLMAYKNRANRSYQLTSMADQFAKLGDLATAKETLALIDTDDLRAAVWRTIGRTQAQAGNFLAAEKSLNQLKKDSDRDSLCYDILNAQIKVDQLAEAEQTWAKMKQTYVNDGGVFLATAYLKKKDVSSAKRCVEKMPDVTRLLDWSFFEAIRNAEQLDWGRQIISQAQPKLTKSNYSGWSNLTTALIKVGDLDGAKRTVASISEDSYKRSACERLAEAGEIDWVKQNPGLCKQPDDDFPLLIAIANGQAKRGDKEGAAGTLDEITKRPHDILRLVAVASIRNRIAGPEAARATLRLSHPLDEDFDGWAGYQIANSSEELAAARMIADAISDPTWKSLTYVAILGREKDLVTQKAMAAAIPDAFYKAKAVLNLSAKELGDGHFDQAIELAALAPIEDLKLIALQAVFATALLREDFQTVEKILQLLPDSESKSALSLRAAKAAVAAGKKDLFVKWSGFAQKAIQTIQVGFWKARAYDELSIIAASAGDTKLSQASSKTALALTTEFGGDDKKNWESYLPVRAFSEADSVKWVEMEKRVDEYARFVESELKDQLYTDFAGYIRANQGKTDQSGVLTGILQAVEGISEKFKKIQKLGEGSTGKVSQGPPSRPANRVAASPTPRKSLALA